MAEQARVWVPRDERRVSPTPTEVPPHPEDGRLPPCEVGASTDAPCPRPAAWHYGYVYYCDEHLESVRCGQDEGEAAMAVYHARRFLWKAQVEGIDRLEHHVGQALAECEKDLEEARKAADGAEKRAQA